MVGIDEVMAHVPPLLEEGAPLAGGQWLVFLFDVIPWLPWF